MITGSLFIQEVPTSSFWRRTPRNDSMEKNCWKHPSQWRHRNVLSAALGM